MEWIAHLQGQVVGLDSATLIYFIEANLTDLDDLEMFYNDRIKLDEKQE